VLVLAVQTSGDLSSLTVVVSDADLDLLSLYLGVSDVYIAVVQ
jgi:hypothetical protein